MYAFTLQNLFLRYLSSLRVKLARYLYTTKIIWILWIIFLSLLVFYFINYLLISYSNIKINIFFLVLTGITILEKIFIQNYMSKFQKYFFYDFCNRLGHLGHKKRVRVNFAARGSNCSREKTNTYKKKLGDVWVDN